MNAICAFGVAVTAACVNRVTSGWNLDIVIISSLMPLVPGVAITNAIRGYAAGGLYFRRCQDTGGIFDRQLQSGLEQVPG